MEIKTLTCLVKSFSIPVVPFPFLVGLPVQDLQRLHSASMAELDSVTLTKKLGTVGLKKHEQNMRKKPGGFKDVIVYPEN